MVPVLMPSYATQGSIVIIVSLAALTAGNIAGPTSSYRCVPMVSLLEVRRRFFFTQTTQATVTARPTVKARNPVDPPTIMKKTSLEIEGPSNGIKDTLEDGVGVAVGGTLAVTFAG